MGQDLFCFVWHRITFNWDFYIPRKTYVYSKKTCQYLSCERDKLYLFRMPQFIMRIWGMSIRSIRRHFRLTHVFLGYFHYFSIVFQVPSYFALIAINYLQFSVFQYIFYCNISYNSFVKIMPCWGLNWKTISTWYLNDDVFCV